MNCLTGALLALFLFCCSAARAESFYLVQPGDTLGNISQKIYPDKKVWGKHGGVRELIILNPRTIKNPNLIFIGAKLKTGPSDVINIERSLSSTEARATTAASTPDSLSPEDRAVTAVTIPTDHVPHEITVATTLAMTTLEADDKLSTTKASLQSEYDLRVGAQWSQGWTPRFSTFAGGDVRLIKFSESTNATRRLSDDNVSTFRLLVGSTYDFTPSFEASLVVSYGGELFIHGLSTSEVGVEAVQIATPALGLKYTFFEKGDTSVSAKGIYGIPLGGTTDSFKVSAGTFYEASVGLKKNFAQSHIGLDLGYRGRNQETTFVDQSESSIFGNVYYAIPLTSGPGVTP